jgi:hypothetical protein
MVFTKHIQRGGVAAMVVSRTRRVAAMVVCRTRRPMGGAKGWPLQAPKGKALPRYILC